MLVSVLFVVFWPIELMACALLFGRVRRLHAFLAVVADTVRVLNVSIEFRQRLAGFTLPAISAFGSVERFPLDRHEQPGLFQPLILSKAVVASAGQTGLVAGITRELGGGANDLALTARFLGNANGMR